MSIHASTINRADSDDQRTGAISNTVRILIGLIAGLAVGALIPHTLMADGALTAIIPVGTLWLNALRMTIIPLVLSLVIGAVASTTDAAKGGRLTARALAWFGGMLIAGVAFAALCAQVILTMWPIDRNTAAALRAGASAVGVPHMPSPMESILNIVPVNIFASLSAGEMLPIVLFGMVFGFAATRLAEGPRGQLLGVVEAIGAVMMTIVHWVLLLAPVGVFALALGVGYHTGVGAAGAVIQYIIVVSGVLILQLLFIIYPVALIFGRVPPLRLLRAYLPPQIVALTTQSSLATLPAMLESTRGALGLSTRATGLVLPLAVSLFRITSPAGNMAVVMVCAHIYGIPLGWAQILTGAVIAVIGSLSLVGIASTVTFFIVPVPMCIAMGVPIDLLPLLLPVEVLPDIWRTIGNVTADLTVATVLGHEE